MARKNRIVVTRPDLARVLAILDLHSKWPHRRMHHFELRKALEQAQIVASGEVPVDVVTLDSDVRVRNSKTGIVRDYTLVCASQADMSASQLSVLGSLGAALFGHRRGDEVEVPMSGGIQWLQIEKVSQPQRTATTSNEHASEAHCADLASLGQSGIKFEERKDMAVTLPGGDRSDAARGRQILKRNRSPRVLCATDLLQYSDRAVSRADAIARELGAQLLLLHVVDAAGSALDTQGRGARARSILNAQARKLARSGNGAQVSVRAGRPHQIIAEVAIKWDADLIVLGPYRRRFGDSFRGTTAERVIRIADRPVLVVNRDSSDPYAHVLLAADLSRMSIGVAHVTKELGLLEGARASVVHALQHTRGATPYLAGIGESEVGKYQQSLRESASDEIDTLLKSAGLNSEGVSVFSQENSPFRAIEQVASRIGSDLVVVGTSRFPLFKRVFIGSVSNEVLRGIEHDVLVISPVAARRAHRKAWIASRRRALDEGQQRIEDAHRRSA
jgi:nucleotide-binding universal stress UspA family protein